MSKKAQFSTYLRTTLHSTITIPVIYSNIVLKLEHVSKSAIYSLHTICCLHIKHLEQNLSHPYQLVSTLTDIFSPNAAFDKQLQCTQYKLVPMKLQRLMGFLQQLP